MCSNARYTTRSFLPFHYKFSSNTSDNKLFTKNPQKITPLEKTKTNKKKAQEKQIN